MSLPALRPYIFILLSCFVIAHGGVAAGDEISGDPFANDDFFSADLNLAEADSFSPERPCNYEIHGYVGSRNRLRFQNTKVISSRQRLWLEGSATYGTVQPDGSAPLATFISGALDLDPAAADLSDDHSVVRGYVEEAYLSLDDKNVSAVIGRKIYRIGTGDGVNPLDLINPLDHRDPVASGKSDSRLPVFLGLLTTDLPTAGLFQETNLEIIGVPLARVNRLNAPGSAWEGAGLKKLRAQSGAGIFILEGQQEPDRLFADGELATRLSATLSGWDLALIGFYGFLDSPVFNTTQVAGPGGNKLHLTPVHPGFYAVGLNFAKGLERSTLRGELAVKPNLPVQAENPAHMPGFSRTRVVEGVFGFDRTFGINIYVNLQYFFTWTDKAAGLASPTWSHSISYEINNTFLRDDLKAGIRGILNFSGEGKTFETYAQYNLGDNWLIETSLLFFEGSESGRYGQFDHNDMATLRVRYSF